MRRRYPGGPRINLPKALIGQMFPSFFRFDPLAFSVGIARRYGDMAHYRLDPWRVYQVNHPDHARQILVEQPEKFFNGAGKEWLSGRARDRFNLMRRKRFTIFIVDIRLDSYYGGVRCPQNAPRQKKPCAYPHRPNWTSSPFFGVLVPPPYARFTRD